jgi:hypothetical protein
MKITFEYVVPTYQKLAFVDLCGKYRIDCKLKGRVPGEYLYELSTDEPALLLDLGQQLPKVPGRKELPLN